ncbi:hypothetical protein AB4K20DRAFT_1877817 [Rhizopus microsporus]
MQHCIGLLVPLAIFIFSNFTNYLTTFFALAGIKASTSRKLYKQRSDQLVLNHKCDSIPFCLAFQDALFFQPILSVGHNC